MKLVRELTSVKYMKTGLYCLKLMLYLKNIDMLFRQKAAKSVDTSLVVRNWLFGFYIVEFEQNGEDRAEYGARLLSNISEKLKKVIGRGFSVDNLELMRRFYLEYQEVLNEYGKSETLSRISSNAISETVSRKSIETARELINELINNFKLGWSHYVSLLTLKSSDERKFYEIETIENSWSVRELKRQMSSALYERLALSRDKKKVKELSEKGQVIGSPRDVIKNPYILEFLNLPEFPHYSEHDLEKAIIDKLENFLLELGKGFLFEARQKRFTFDDDHFYVDLVFYNRLLRCYVLIDLKLDKLSHQDLGQMQMYVNYFDRYVKTDFENPTIGILLCSSKNDSVVELTLPKDANIHASEYQLYLPSKEELRKQIQEAEKELENQDRNKK